MRPLEDSYARIAAAKQKSDQPITIRKVDDEWRVSCGESHGQGGTIELAALRLATFIEARGGA